jgi:hypothetical protein
MMGARSAKVGEPKLAAEAKLMRLPSKNARTTRLWKLFMFGARRKKNYQSR